MILLIFCDIFVIFSFGVVIIEKIDGKMGYNMSCKNMVKITASIIEKNMSFYPIF